MSEKKELKEEDINKVSGGDEDKILTCPKCLQQFKRSEVIYKDGVRYCPKCNRILDLIPV